MERYALLEWLFFKLISLFLSDFIFLLIPEQCGGEFPLLKINQTSEFCESLIKNLELVFRQNLQGDAGVRDEETVRIQYLAEIAKFLGFTPTVDIEAIQGHGTYEDRMEMLRNIVDLVEASLFSDNPEWSIDEQVAKDIQLIDAIAERQSLIFSEECKLFPADVQIQSIYPLPDVSEPETKLSEQAKILSNLQQKVDDLAAMHAYNPDEEYAEVESELRARLELFLETARAFNTIYTKFLGNLKNLRDSHAALSIGSSGGTVAGEPPSSVNRIVSECEAVLTVLNRDLGILSASIAREQGERL
ncbi:unnamed protein product [Brassica oleracea]